MRFVIGMFAATLSMCLTGVVEIFRQQKCESCIQQTIGMDEFVTFLYISFDFILKVIRCIMLLICRYFIKYHSILV